MAGTTRIPTRGAAAAPNEPPTTRFSTAKSAVRSAVDAVGGATQRAPRQEPPQRPREDREIESWLGALKGRPTDAPPPNPRPSADSTRAIPPQRPTPQTPDATQAIPTPRTEDPGSTEKLKTPEPEKGERRRGGGLSARELLRREGRL